MALSCKKENRTDCFKPNGKEITEERSMGSFKVIQVNCKSDLTIHKGNGFKVELTAGKNIIQNIGTVLSGDTLKIENNNKCNFVRGYKKTIRVDITLPYVKYLVNNSVGTVRFDENYIQDTLEVRTESSGDIHIGGTYKQISASSNGNGDIYMNGSTNRLFAYLSGTNYLYAGELTVNDFVFIETLTLGDCYINAVALKRFDYHIHKSGKIYYQGNPPEINNLSEDPVKFSAIKQE